VPQPVKGAWRRARASFHGDASYVCAQLGVASLSGYLARASCRRMAAGRRGPRFTCVYICSIKASVTLTGGLPATPQPGDSRRLAATENRRHQAKTVAKVTAGASKSEDR